METATGEVRVRRFSVLILIGMFLTLQIAADSPEELFSAPLGLVIIDPGHGGDDPGAVATLPGDEKDAELRTVYEKDINLSIAMEIAAALRRDLPEVSIVLTRESDSNVSLWKRAEIANKALVDDGRGKLFISVHANSAAVSEAQGTEIWVLPETANYNFLSTEIPEVLLAAAVESSNAAMNRALDRAERLLSHAIELELALTLAGITRNRGIKHAAFYVLEHTYMPAVLVETGFMSNTDELKMLIDPAHQQRVAGGVVRGISYYAEILGAE